jgi:hypothetical protein
MCENRVSRKVAELHENAVIRTGDSYMMRSFVIYVHELIRYKLFKNGQGDI